MSANVNLDEVLEFAISLAKEAGSMIKAGQQKRFASDHAVSKEKVNSVDLVTEVDQAVEAFIFSRIAEKYPDHKTIGEETYNGEKVTDAPTWIVDPIDGTTNFIHGYPFVCCSIGVTVGGIPVVGVIYNPFLDHLYSAAKGKGAFLNGTQRLPLTGAPKPLNDLGDALIAVEYGSQRSGPAINAKIGSFKKLAADKKDGGKMVHSLRSAGSAAINICLVASGSVDAYWEIGCWPWDVCAGMCILKEAGGASFGGKIKEKDFSGEPTTDIMVGRNYLFVRAIAPEGGDTAIGAQGHIAREFYDTVTEYEP